MGKRLVVVFEVDDDVDPARVDPHEIADDLVAMHYVENRANGHEQVVVAVAMAEWETSG